MSLTTEGYTVVMGSLGPGLIQGTPRIAGVMNDKGTVPGTGPPADSVYLHADINHLGKMFF